MSQLKIYLLGAPRIEWGEEPVVLDRRKGLALVAYLAATGVPERREALVSLLWPDLDRERAFAALRRTLVSLNEAFKGSFVRVGRKVIELEAGQVWVDVQEFERLLKEGTTDVLAQAIDLYKGEFLSGFTLRDSDSFDEWQLLQSEQFRRKIEQALQTLVGDLEDSGQYEKAIEYGHRWLALDSLSEETHRRLMKLYALAGRRSEALRQYEKCAEILKKELQVDPEPETTALWQSIKEGAIRSARLESPTRERPTPEPVAFRPPVKRVTKLPAPATTFIGREAELAHIEERLLHSSCRLLTLVGPGGIGKTRLAIEAAHRLAEHFAQGAFFVPLAGLYSPALLVSAIGEVLGVEFDPNIDPELQLLNQLRDTERLLVLDNFEHLKSAALISSILQRAPQVRLIVTSRERVNIQGEWLLEVGGLSTPAAGDLEDIEDFDAVQLFINAAGRVQSDFSLNAKNKPAVARICKLVAGMPLGIELSAVWLRALSCEAIAKEIERNLDFLTSTQGDLPERHRSLRAVFNYSVGLLSEEERTLFSRLSIFEGGFGAEAAMKVAGANLNLLLALIDKSLIVRSQSERYEMHSLLRQFAAEELGAQSQEADGIRHRHCAYFLTFVQQQGENFKRQQKEALETLRADIENVRAAWRWGVLHSELELIRASLDALYQFYLRSGSVQEGTEALAPVVEKFEITNSVLSAKAAARLGQLFIPMGKFEEARKLLAYGLSKLENADDAGEMAFILTHMSAVHFHLGEYAEAKIILEEAVRLYRRAGDRRGTANALVQLGRMAAAVGTQEEARLQLNTALVIFQELGDSSGVGRCLVNLGGVACLSKSFLEAIRVLQEGLEIFRSIGDRRGTALCLSNLAIVYEDLQEHEQAQKFAEEGLALMREIHDLDNSIRLLDTLGRASFGLGEFDRSRRYFHEALQTAVEVEAIPVALIAMLGMARLILREGKAEKGAEILSLILHHPKANSEAKAEAENLLNQIGGEKSAAPKETDFTRLAAELL